MKSRLGNLGQLALHTQGSKYHPCAGTILFTPFSTFWKLRGVSTAGTRLQLPNSPMFLSHEVAGYRRKKGCGRPSQKRIIAYKVGPEIKLEIQ